MARRFSKKAPKTPKNPTASCALEYFKVKRGLGAVLRDLKGKLKKVKGSGQDGPRVRMLELKVEAHVTKSMVDELGSPLRDVLEAAALGNVNATPKVAFDEIKLHNGFPAIVRIFGRSDFSGKTPLFEKGLSVDDPVTFTLKRLFVRNGMAYLGIQVVCNFDKALWAWAGEVFGGDTDLVLEVEPLKVEEQDNGGPLLKEAVETVTIEAAGKSVTMTAKQFKKLPEKIAELSRTGLPEVVAKGEAIIEKALKRDAIISEHPISELEAEAASLQADLEK
jgi:hypothetical protein